jgi:hypothetical protein
MVYSRKSTFWNFGVFQQNRPNAVLQLLLELAVSPMVDTAGLVTSQKKAVNPNRINRFGMTGVSGFA